MPTVQMSVVLPIDLALILDEEKGDVTSSQALRCILQYLSKQKGSITSIIKSEYQDSITNLKSSDSIRKYRKYDNIIKNENYDTNMDLK